VEEAITEEAVVVTTTAFNTDVAEVEVEGGDTVNNPTTIIDLVTITTTAMVVVEVEDVPEIDSVPGHLPSKIRKRPCSVKCFPL